jgi:hypothetical protein
MVTCPKDDITRYGAVGWDGVGRFGHYGMKKLFNFVKVSQLLHCTEYSILLSHIGYVT